MFYKLKCNKYERFGQDFDPSHYMLPFCVNDQTHSGNNDDKDQDQDQDNNQGQGTISYKICPGTERRLVESNRMANAGNDKYPVRRDGAESIIRNVPSNVRTNLGKYNYKMHIGRMRGSDQGNWMWGVTKHGIVQFQKEPTDFVFEPKDRSKDNTYFRYQDDFLIKVNSGPFSGKYLGDVQVNYNGKCGRVVAVRPSREQASYFVVAPYYDTCDKNCPQPQDRHCAPVLFYEHCRPEIRIKADDGQGAYYRVIGYGKNPSTRQWDGYKYLASADNAYPKQDPYENPSTVVFMDLPNVPGRKTSSGEYDEFGYEYSQSSAWHTNNLCRKCMVYKDKLGNLV